MYYMAADDVTRIHFALVKIFKEAGDPIAPAGVRPGGLLESALGRPRTSLGKVEKYPSLALKAGAVLHSLIANHPFHNGNKRTSLVATLAFLERNGHRITAPDDDLFDLVLAVACRRHPFSGGPDASVEAIGEWFDARLVASIAKPGVMTAERFRRRCEAAGCAVRRSKGSWIVRGPHGQSVSFNVDTRKLERNVVRAYLNKLGLSVTRTGIHLDEFRNGIAPEQDLIRIFRAVLNRLAHV